MRWSAESQEVIASRWMHMDNIFRMMRAREAAELIQPHEGPQGSHGAIISQQSLWG